MNWEQKLAALQALGDTSLRMREPGNWYVNGAGEIAQDRMLVGEYGNGATPEAAVNDHWQKFTGTGQIVRLSGDRRVTWRGFMWADVPR